MVVFTWASWNGATYYIDVFGRRMEKEFNKLKEEVARMSKSPDMDGFASPVGSPEMSGKEGGKGVGEVSLGPAAQSGDGGSGKENGSLKKNE